MNKTETKKMIRKKFQKGISLVELLVAIFVLTLILMTVTTVAVSYIRGKIRIQKYQQDVEDLSIVLNEMSKKLRMSNCDTDLGGACVFSASHVKVIKNTSSTGNVNYYDYQFAGNKLIDVSTGATMLENVSGGFSSSENGIPRITITVMRTNSDGTKRLETAVQTTVSLRSGYTQP